MNRTARSVRVSCLAALALSSWLGCKGTESGGPEAAAGRVALQAVRDRLGAQAGDVRVAGSARASFPELGRTVVVFKIRDGAGTLHRVAVDDASKVVDVQELAAADRAARTSRDGALDAAVIERLRQSPDARHSVIVWIVDRSRGRDSRPPIRAERLSTSQIDALYERNEAARAADLAPQLARVMERVRRVDPAARASTASPALAMTANGDALKTLARDPDIDRIYLDLNGTPESGESAKIATGISGLHAGGLKGSGVRVAMTEAEGLVEPASLLLNPIVQDSTNVCSTPSAHTTEVAGIIKGRRITIFGTTAGLEGAAPLVTLRVGGSCSTNSVELMEASTRAANWGARVISMSWGLDTQLKAAGVDRFYDDMTFNRWRTVVKSAGNRGCKTPADESSGPGSGLTTTPGLGFNVITVGGFDDADTGPWADDSLYVCTSFANPISTHGDREKPELSAPAVDLTVTTTGPANMTVASGTSGASPMVASAVALMIERNGLLSFWPEIVRAILMATATHNIEGSGRLSDKDGAGGLNAAEAVSLAQDPKRNGGQWYTCDGSTASPLRLTTLIVPPRTRQRIVISWDTDPSDPNYPNEPTADIDLEVVDAQGRILAASRSFDGANEIVDFNTFTGATVTVQAVKFRCDLPTWLGWAWHTTPLKSGPR